MSVKSGKRTGRRMSLGWPLAVGLALVLGFLLWRGSERGGIASAWSLLFGPADLGPVTFSNLVRRSTSNDALACPADLCPTAPSDLTPPPFPVPRERLRAIVAEVAAEDGDSRPVEQVIGEQDRYVARTRVLRFPDTIDVLTVDLGEGRSTLAIYSRSQVGFFDFGVNRARIEHWLKRIGELAAETPALTDG